MCAQKENKDAEELVGCRFDWLCLIPLQAFEWSENDIRVLIDIIKPIKSTWQEHTSWPFKKFHSAFSFGGCSLSVLGCD